MSLNSDYQDITGPDSLFWRELGVSIDSILELSEETVTSILKSTLNRQKKGGLEELCSLYGLKPTENKEDNLGLLLTMEFEKKREILILQDFQNRRKHSIDKYYVFKFINEEKQFNSSSLTKLIHLYKNSLLNMIGVYTLNSWDIKGSGDKYTFEKGITLEEALKIPMTYRDTLINYLFKGSGQNKKYRVFSYTKIDSKIIVILYKQINDLPRPDFDKALRNKEVVPLIFCLDVKEKVIEIKSASITDKKNLIKYFSENFDGCNPTPVKTEVFEDYKKEEVINAFIKGIPPKPADVKILESDDFIVNKITFRESPISNSPKITLELENEDIWPSVIYAHTNNCVNLASLKDIEGLTIKSGGKSRAVRSIISENGNVLFIMDDSRLDDESKKTIISNFRKKFGIPLNQEIANSKFDAGKTDKIDYVMTTRKADNLDSDSIEILRELKEKYIIEPITKDCIYCSVCKLTKEISEGFNIEDGCPECGNEELKIKKINEHKLNMRSIKSLVRTSLKKLDDWNLSKDESNIVFDDNEHLNFYNLKHKEKDEILQVLVTDQSLPISVTNRLKTMMTPTIIIFVGQLEKFIHSYNSDCLQSITFGNLYLQEEHMFQVLYTNLIFKLKQRLKSYVSNAASIAATSLNSLLNDFSLISSKKYTNKKFEDDIYAILKDLFPNSAKWGKEASGKPLPEGIFAITHFQKGPTETEVKRVFSYDCKLNENTLGYNLSRSEQRKAAEYVNKLNNNDIIVNFSDKKELTGHVFISNKFKEKQFENMQEYFYEFLGANSNAKPIFISLEVLLKLHTLYRSNFQHLSNSRNIFSKFLIAIFSKEVITAEIVDAAFKKVLNPNVQEYDQLDTGAVSDFIDDDIL